MSSQNTKVSSGIMSLNMHFIRGNQMNIKALEVNIKHGYIF